MGLRDLLPLWPVARQVTGDDRFGVGEAARSTATELVGPRTDHADRVVPSICPFCAVGCGQRIHVKDDEVLHVEGDPDSPISRGRLCARGSSTKDMVTGPNRELKVRYRRAGGRDWEDLDLDTAMDMIADRVIATRDETWQERDDQGRSLRRTMGFGSLGGAACDNEENYLLKKLFTALGAIQVENQARI
ncbi:dehydrogenase [Nitriliruptoraceae bacterium ZYF776]|nr:dehydrogenase [Profundirhabdus halotolerans]